MPFYDFKCEGCDYHEERLLTISRRDMTPDPCPRCSGVMQRIPSSPALSIWDGDRSFPLSGVSDGIKFPSKQAYQDHLKANGWDEFSTDAPAYSKPCTWRKVYGRQ